MRRRIREAIVGVSAALLLLLGLPLAVAVHRLILDSEVVELQASAARTLAEIDVPLNAGQLSSIAAEADAPPPFTVYGAKGDRVFGPGPAETDAVVALALRGTTASRVTDQIVVSTPIIDTRSERVVGAVLVTSSLRAADHRSRTAWLLMAAAAAVALGIAWLTGNRLARRLSDPISELAASAAQIGDGGTLRRPEPSGMSEIDTLAEVLGASTERVSEALARERRFSSDVSHQLRTPLTGLRLRLETARDNSDVAVFSGALSDLDRLESTVNHLLAVARDSMPVVSNTYLDEAVLDAVGRWHRRAEAAGQSVSASSVVAATARGSAASVAQVLDVLIDNALVHGLGAVELAVRRLPGGAAIDVRDEGTGILPAAVGRIFERGHGSGHGIGLALARSMVEADGGRLVLAHFKPTTFSLILVDHDLDIEVDRS